MAQNSNYHGKKKGLNKVLPTSLNQTSVHYQLKEVKSMEYFRFR